MYLPVTSIRCASDGTFTLLLEPMATILPPRVTTVAFAMGGSPVPSITVAPTKANVPVRRPGSPRAEIGKRGHLVTRRAGDELRECRLVLFAHGFEVVELGIGRDQRRQGCRCYPSRAFPFPRSGPGWCSAPSERLCPSTSMVSAPRSWILTSPLGSVANCAGEPCARQ